MLSRTALNIVRRSICNNARTLYYARDPLQSNLLTFDNSVMQSNIQNQCKLYVARRFKSGKKKDAKKRKQMDEESDDEEDDTEDAPVGSKVITASIQTCRVDAISKVGFGISRNKIEEAFYESKLRVNGQKVFKKSKELEVGDEVDIVLHRSVDNPEFLVVNRIVILSMNPTANDTIQVKMSREKNLLIEDYEDRWSEV